MFGIGFTELLAFGAFALAAFLYFLPWFMAWNCDHPSSRAIFYVNLLLGWTFLGWLAAGFWALSTRGSEPLFERQASLHEVCVAPTD